MSTPKHLVVAVRALPHHCIGGMQTVAWDLATAFAREGLSVTVLTAEIPGRPEVFEDHGIQVRALPGTTWHRYSHGWNSATRNAFARELLGRCDLALSISAGGYGLLPLRSRMPFVPFVLQAHGTSIRELKSKLHSGHFRAVVTSPRNIAWTARDLLAYSHFDAIVPVGSRIACDFAAWPIRRAVGDAIVRVIPNGIDTTRFRPDAEIRIRMRSSLGLGDDLKVIVSVGRLHRQKGLGHSLRAVSVLAHKNDDIRLLVIGDGPDASELKATAARLGISNRVIFIGAVPRELIPSYLNAADVMLFTTTHAEGEPLNALEALAVGLPVVASGHLYSDGTPTDAIFPVEPEDPHEVAAALSKALDPRKPRLSALPAGRTMTDTVDAYLSLFEQLMHQRRQ